jgi:hypothetical protein
MRIAIIAATAVLAGCGLTPEQMARQSDYQVCRFSTTPASGEVAHYEAQRRGLDCRPYYGVIQQQRANEAAAIQNFQRSLSPQPMPQMPMPINCTSYRTGNTVQTRCD